MPNLFPVFEVPSALAENAQQPKKYRPAPLWDFEQGDFAEDGARRPVYGSGYDAWVFWCIKTIRTQRWAHAGYSGNAGVEAEEAFMEPDRNAVESAFEAAITEALLADPMGRTLRVHDFKFSWNGDGLRVSCIVSGADGAEAAISASFKN